MILAGGLGPDNVAEAIRAVRPAGVDSKIKTDRHGSHQKDLKPAVTYLWLNGHFKTPCIFRVDMTDGPKHHGLGINHDRDGFSAARFRFGRRQIPQS